jgi:hypothetical protein
MPCSAQQHVTIDAPIIDDAVSQRWVIQVYSTAAVPALLQYFAVFISIQKLKRQKWIDSCLLASHVEQQLVIHTKFAHDV